MTIFARQWLAPSPPVVFNPLTIGVAFLVNIGYTGPIAEASPTVHGITATQRHLWPPFGLTSETRRSAVARHVLGALDSIGADPEAVYRSLMGLAARKDDSIFLANPPEIGPIKSAGVCLEPALTADDPIVEIDGPVQPGDLCATILRGEPVPRVKVFAGLIDRGHGPAALFYFAKPEGVIEVYLDDILWVSRVTPQRSTDGRSLLAKADPLLGRLLADNGVLGELHQTGKTRQGAWIESILAILAVLRDQPE